MLIDKPKEKIKFCIVGSGINCCIFSKMLIENNFPKPVLVTWKKEKHKRDKQLLSSYDYYQDIFSFCGDNSILLIEASNVNNKETISKLKSLKVDIIFSISSRWIIKKNTIDQFNGLVINLHQGDLPLERGSVIYQRIMNNNNSIGVSLHMITPGIDEGNILYKEITKIEDKDHTISNVNNINIQLAKNIFKNFISDLIERKNIKEEKQNNNKSIYMPQFYSEVNGAIDWDWKAIEIDRFIRAFGPPFPGAFTFFKDEKIFLLESYVEETNQIFHPYFKGRIVTIKDDMSIRIVTKKHFLVVNKIKYKNFIGMPGNMFKLNSHSVFSTPRSLLENARKSFTSSLNMKKVKKI